MFKSLLNLFKRPAAAHPGAEKQATADGVRKFAKVTYITPARQRGETRVTFTAAQVADLRRYISDLQAAITTLSGSFRARKGVYITGGKGL